MLWLSRKSAPSLRSIPFHQFLLPIFSLTRYMSTRTYQDAVEHLNSLQSNAASLEAVRASGGRSSQFAIPEMIEYLERVGYQPHALNSLNVIHITGTKGKGSTSAFTDSILRNAQPGWKIGLYTSPHLVAVRERIRINGAPVSEEIFTKYFFEVWDKLFANNLPKAPTTPPMPGYFRFLTLMAYHVFLKERVDATILEVGVGGTYDSTNIVPRPIVTGITALGIDHVAVLGKTIEEIAWQKSGIYKEGVPALTVVQPQNAMQVIESRAKELKAKDLKVVSETTYVAGLPLGLAGGHQVQNASLAVELAHTFLDERSKHDRSETYLPDSFREGLISAKWPGRCQSVPDPRRSGITWFLDGAHTLESLDCCMQWFVTPGTALSEQPYKDSKVVRRVLIFNCTSGRSGSGFLRQIRETARLRLSLYKRDIDAEFFDHVIFCTNVTYADGHFKGDLTTKAIADDDLAHLTTQKALATAWIELSPSFSSSNIHVLPSVEHAVRTLEVFQDNSDIPVQVLVTGSLHLVGGVIEAAGLSDVALTS
ncbi:tetrahydrofolylpolyglutamate synthase [Crepidotus variabilis]|uniref:Folylpolyglutamate synthase n=1 Tax=Crepidotus variabilis TaxID=179855 RepID=A0A9P6JVN6_9AGAR|nr:tetrahydrofolylpolyglutamate synthase [Crepidotus variabilis]